MKPKDLDVTKEHGYIDGKNMVHLAGEETTPQPKNDEIVVFKSFFQAELWLPMYRMIAPILKKSMKCIYTN